MSCSRECYDKCSPWFGHDDCSTCVGQDSGMTRMPGGPLLKFCAHCKDYHTREDWPHEPSADNNVGYVDQEAAADFNAIVGYCLDLDDLEKLAQAFASHRRENARR